VPALAIVDATPAVGKTAVVIVDCALYEAGKRVDYDRSVDTLCKLDEHPEAFAWIGFAMPTPEELTSACEALGISEFVDVEDVLAPHRQPVLSVDGPIVNVVLRTARYVDREEKISLGELTLLVSERALISIRFGHATPLARLRAELEAEPELLARGTSAVLVAIVEQVIADYSPALNGFEQDVIEVERDVFSDGGPQPVRRLYQLKREVRTFQSPLEALPEPLARLGRHLRRTAEREVVEDFNEASDQLERTIHRTRSLSNLLDAALTASLAQTGIQQNEDMRKISAWVAMAAVPTLIAGIYGMNFDEMPELRSPAGYPVVMIGMIGIVALMYRYFRRNDWL
jgi:magnesium transporter